MGSCPQVCREGTQEAILHRMPCRALCASSGLARWWVTRGQMAWKECPGPPTLLFMAPNPHNCISGLNFQTSCDFCCSWSCTLHFSWTAGVILLQAQLVQATCQLVRLHSSPRSWWAQGRGLELTCYYFGNVRSAPVTMAAAKSATEHSALAQHSTTTVTVTMP